MYNNRGVYLAETEDAYVNGQYDEIEISEDSNYECMMEQLNKMNFYNQAILTDYFMQFKPFKNIFNKDKPDII